MTKHYYAEFCPYGVRTISSDDCLMQFDTVTERDEIVNTINRVSPNRERAAIVTVRDVKHAYNMEHFNNADKYHSSVVTTCYGREWREIYHSRKYLMEH